jgi:hypothetical protein
MGKSGRKFRERDNRRNRHQKVEAKRRWLTDQPREQRKAA